MKKDSGPKPLSALFEKYKKRFKAPEATVVHTFIEVVDEVLGITVPESVVKFSPASRMVSIVKGGPLKTEIMLHKTELLGHMAGRLGVQSAPKDIL